MDLKTSGKPATLAERDAIDLFLISADSSVVDKIDTTNGSSQISSFNPGGKRHLLLPTLHALQERVGGLSHGALDYLGLALGIPPAEAYGVASFYGLFSLDEMAETVVHVCDDIACRAFSNSDPAQEMVNRFGEPGQIFDGLRWERSPCLGRCEEGSAAFVQCSGDSPRRFLVAPFDPRSFDLPSFLAKRDVLRFESNKLPRSVSPSTPLTLLKRIGAIDHSSLDSYRAQGGYLALDRALAIGAENVVREIKDARLMGRGGAAFPTSTKWEAVARNPVRPHYFVCNADESEPGTFKDRVVMEKDPFSVIEGMTIAGLATGSEKGYLYIRGEYPLAEERITAAISQARKRGLLGSSILGREFNFDIELRRGAGAYIAGEETALFNSIEGKRAEPRNKPPFPAQAGLFGKPTGVNNVETLLNVVEILTSGGMAFADVGTKDSTGTRLFCLSGAVANPGLYEAPFGITLRSLLDSTGGLRPGSDLKALLLGGAAGSFVTPDQLDLELSFEGVRAVGTTLGSGVVMAFDQNADMNMVVRRIAQFFRDESCGQCVPCRVGTARQEELLSRLSIGELLGTRQDELALLAGIGSVMRDSSICGLGQTASSAVESALRLGLI